jgi:hypothetical protein
MKRALAVGILLTITSLACEKKESAPAKVPNQSVPKPFVGVQPSPLPGGVYFFAVTGREYRMALSEFLKTHPELRCSYFGPDFRSEFPNSHWATLIPVGHTIVCEDVADEAQSETIQ